LYYQKKNIDYFAHISVREPQGKKTLAQVTEHPISICIDPTLMIPSEEWERLAAKPIVKGKYIFFYSYNYGDDTLNRLVKEASSKLDLPVYVINASRWIQKDIKTYGFNLAAQGGPIAFLSLMKYADFVFVQSLHGSIFASIFKKNFWFLSNRETDALDQRSENILSLLNARNRTIRPNNFEFIDLRNSKDYSHNSELDTAKDESMRYLKECYGL
ncbi:MAG: polysaccharide pyruvyl transferase family protein, partial [Sphaerochaetaceae bacterium]|nr:polysaccharide pyruvyl transferase family protein [Sphaerochaetaceae bacterium]